MQIETSTLLFGGLIAFILQLIILYYLIRSAVDAGTRKQRDLLRQQLRIMIKNLENEGMTRVQIVAALQSKEIISD
jgi:carbon starvation protein CstA